MDARREPTARQDGAHLLLGGGHLPPAGRAERRLRAARAMAGPVDGRGQAPHPGLHREHRGQPPRHRRLRGPDRRADAAVGLAAGRVRGARGRRGPFPAAEARAPSLDVAGRGGAPHGLGLPAGAHHAVVAVPEAQPGHPGREGARRIRGGDVRRAGDRQQRHLPVDAGLRPGPEGRPAGPLSAERDPAVALRAPLPAGRAARPRAGGGRGGRERRGGRPGRGRVGRGRRRDRSGDRGPRPEPAPHPALRLAGRAPHRYRRARLLPAGRRSLRPRLVRAPGLAHHAVRLRQRPPRPLRLHAREPGGRGPAAGAFRRGRPPVRGGDSLDRRPPGRTAARDVRRAAGGPVAPHDLGLPRLGRPPARGRVEGGAGPGARARRPIRMWRRGSWIPRSSASIRG